MSYITRCPNCRTAFKVTEPQLAAHGGKVRCGKCAFIFNARDSLEARSSLDAPTIAAPAPAAPAEVTVKPAQPEASPARAVVPPAPVAEAVPAPRPAPAPVPVPVPVPAPAPIPVPAPFRVPVAVPAPVPEPIAKPAAEPVAFKAAEPPVEPAPVFQTPTAETPAIAVEPIAPPATQATVPAPEKPAERAGTESVQDWLQNSYVQAIAAIAADAEARDYDDYVAPATPQPAPVPAALQPAPPVTKPQPVVAPHAAAEETIEEEDAPIFSVPLETWSEESKDQEAYRPIRTAEDDALLALPPEKSKWRYVAVPVALLLVFALILQAGVRYRNELSVNFPWLRPSLASMCELARCDLPLPRNASLLRSDYSELIFVPDHPELIQLSASLRNLATYDQALPALELTLTNAQEEVVAKKVFSAKDYLVANEKKRTGLAVNDELHVFLQLDARGLGASGYSLYWFYP